ncbi:hypothetical protein, partial [Paenibacillus xylanexedens]|uniref:hypothetical protein n=1 Tax=Paenibacillus xylanexedens TaxID=528191 RepID=UPI001642A4D1
EGAGIEVGVSGEKAWKDVLKKGDGERKGSLEGGYENVGRLEGEGKRWEDKRKGVDRWNMGEVKGVEGRMRERDEKKI